MSAAAGGRTAAVFQVRTRPTVRSAGQVAALALLVLASAAFVASGATGRAGAGAVMFITVGVLGLGLFGVGLLRAVGVLLGRRPVLELDDTGVRRPARWPLPRRADRVLPWPRVAAMCALRRGMAGTRRGEQDYLVFLPSAELAEAVRTARRSLLVALTLPDVSAAALPGARDAAAWCFAVDPAWDASLKEVVAAVRGRHRVPVIDRRKV
ncbi:hypothetical protein Acsp04_01030 [Actinomadura sp. NBRC 104425]|uniref:hypothetical protein n=1 Tax=Actinomadura sp. NBRC 104425 TaxID=3032204 RepID=UPI0024A0B4FD|nr:hypothetical protein [Actinomadura sp. NBRC 104425]GLZ09867.1 hypothetical protein Acsp04_01030 [Actinomadura sp. NBRC 104425]